MGLAIDGNVVHGIARGGQAFVAYGGQLFDFSKAVFGTKIYFSDQAAIGRFNADDSQFKPCFYAAGPESDYVDGNFNDCRLTGATYISANDIDTGTVLNPGAGMYYCFSEFVNGNVKGNYLIRADQVSFSGSGNSMHS